MPVPYANTPGTWQTLLVTAFRLIDDAQARCGHAFDWSMGGGTALMLRHRHRVSKDIDIFVSDPQILGFLNPRLGGLAEDIAERHDEGAMFVKLYLPEGEIDFVVSAPLTSPGWEPVELLGRTVRLETDVEIVTKKLWHRGQSAKARDLLDLCLVIQNDPERLRAAAPFLVKNREAFLTQLENRRDILKSEFEALDTLDYSPEFEASVQLARDFLLAL